MNNWIIQHKLRPIVYGSNSVPLHFFWPKHFGLDIVIELQLILQFRMRDTWLWKVTISLLLESSMRSLYGLLNFGFLAFSSSILLRSYLAIYSKWTESGRPNNTIQPWLGRGYDAIILTLNKLYNSSLVFICVKINKQPKESKMVYLHNLLP